MDFLSFCIEFYAHRWSYPYSIFSMNRSWTSPVNKNANEIVTIVHGMYQTAMSLGQNFFITWFTNPPTAIFRTVGKKKKFLIFFLFYPPTLNIICLVEKIIYFSGSVCVFLRLTLLKVIVLSRFLGKWWKYRLLVFLTSFTVFSGDVKKYKKIDLKKKKKKDLKKKSSEKDKLTGHFQSFFICFFFRPLVPKSEKKSRKSTNKKFWP